MRKILYIFISALLVLSSAGLVFASSITKTPQGINQGLVAHWDFDGNDSRGGANAYALDSSGNNNTATGVGSPLAVQGKIGQGMKTIKGSFSAVSSASLNFLNSTNALTISLWINPDNLSGLKYILDRQSGGYSGYYITSNATTPGQLKVGFPDGAAWNEFASAGVVSAKKWTHVVTTHNGTQQKIYLNGVLDNSRNQTISLVDNSATLKLGTAYLAGWEFPGSLDDVRIYSRALSASEISQLYSMGGSKIDTSISQGGLNSGLVGWWTMDGADTNATQVKDKSGNNYTGTRTAITPIIGKIGQAMKFNGRTSAIYNTAFSQGDTLTYSTWIKTSALATNGYIIDTEGGGGLNAGMGIYSSNATTLLCVVDDGVTQLTVSLSNPGIADNKWHHVSCTKSSTDLVTLYIDGVNRTSNTLSVGDISQTSATIGIGLRSDLDTLNMGAGSLDDIRVYNRALSQSEITQLYSLGGSKIASSPPSITQGLVGWWTFDGQDSKGGAGGYALDKSGNGNTAVATGSPTAVSGKIAQAMKFGAGNSLASPNITQLTSATKVTYSFWTKLDALPANHRVMSVWGNSQNQMAVQFQNTNIAVYTASSLTDAGNNYCAMGGMAEVGKWAHYVVVYDGAQSTNNTKLSIYKNGLKQSISCAGTIPDSLTNSSNGLTLSQYTGFTGNELNGSLDDVRVYNRALSAQEIQQLYALGR